MKIDDRAVRHNFIRWAKTYDENSFLSREVDRRMMMLMEYIKIDPQWVLDLGCGTGASLAALSEQFPGAQVVGIDIVADMLKMGKQKMRRMRWLMPFLQRMAHVQLVCGDARRLPFADNCFDLIWSNLMLHWVDETAPVFTEAVRVLNEGGLFMFSAFGPDTLKELRACGFSTHDFIDMHDLGDWLVDSGFSDPVMSMDTVILTYGDFDHILAELRYSGGASARSDRSQKPVGRAVWKERVAAYEALSAAQGEKDRLPLTFEIVYGHAWKDSSKSAQTNAVKPLQFYPQKPGVIG